jgi:hypothetical protein
VLGLFVKSIVFIIILIVVKSIVFIIVLVVGSHLTCLFWFRCPLWSPLWLVNHFWLLCLLCRLL